MMVDATTITASKGEEMISKFAKDFNMSEGQYLADVASKCYVLVKDSKSGLKVATFDDEQTPQIFNSYALAMEEMEDKVNTDVAYKGYRIMNERKFWDAIGATEIYSLAIVC